MSKVVYFKPLDGIGEVPLDLHACPRRFVISPDDTDEDEDEDEKKDVLIFYQTPDCRWVRHQVLFFQNDSPDETFCEVNPKYVAECFVVAGRKMPPELEPHWEAVKASQQEGVKASQQVNWGIKVPDPFEPMQEAQVEMPDLVTLDQAAAAAHKSKRSLERHKTKGTLPEPVVEGGGGKHALYDWNVMRPWLTKTYSVILPEKFPANLR
jgi:hypothetical protein